MEQSTQPGERLNQDFLNLDSAKQKPRGESRIKMRVVNRNTRVLQIQQGHIGPGEHVIKVYKSDVPKVVAMLEDPAAIKAAEAQFINDVAERVSGRAEWRGTIDELKRVIASKTDDDVNKAHAWVMNETELSVQASFRKMFKRDMLPLDAAEVIPDSDEPEPARKQVEDETVKISTALSSALETALLNVVGKLGLGGGDAIKSMVRSELEEQLGGKPETRGSTKPGR